MIINDTTAVAGRDRRCRRRLWAGPRHTADHVLCRTGAVSARGGRGSASRPIATGLDIARPLARLVEAGVIDRDKFVTAHKNRGPVPEWVSQALEGKSQELILSIETAAYNLNLLWPLGLATRATFNADSPLRGDDLANFASTGGWTIGRESNGAVYFDAVETLTLTPEQAALVRRLAGNVYRPCCGNSAFFQDCNHGSAMLALMELAAANGRNSAELWIWPRAQTASGIRRNMSRWRFISTPWKDGPGAPCQRSGPCLRSFRRSGGCRSTYARRWRARECSHPNQATAGGMVVRCNGRTSRAVGRTGATCSILMPGAQTVAMRLLDSVQIGNVGQFPYEVRRICPTRRFPFMRRWKDRVHTWRTP